jgi:pSer/pThr/pTyr-binding forkhead associated (FHA) protein
MVDVDFPNEEPESAAEQTANIELVRCSSCGHISEPGSKFCSACGESLVEETSVLTATEQPPPPQKVDDNVLTGLGSRDAVLIVQKGPDDGSRFPLSGAKVTVGRSPDAMIFLDDVTVSRRHAELTSTADDWKLVDNGSLNGSYVNRNRIDECALTNGDEVQIGKYRFVFHQAPAS